MGTFLVFGCSHQGAEAPAFLFAGECTVEVISQTSGADIQIDGVSVGREARMKVEIPCGEKQVSVVKEGFAPYRAYLPTTKQAPLQVTVKLERVEVAPNFALSSELARQVELGMKPVDPSTPEGKSAIAKAEKEAADRFAQQVTAAKSAGSTAGGPTTGSSAGTGAALGPGPWDTVDYWR